MCPPSNLHYIQGCNYVQSLHLRGLVSFRLIYLFMKCTRAQPINVFLFIQNDGSVI